MDEKTLTRLLEDMEYLEKRILFYQENSMLFKSDARSEIIGHLEKARHNLSFLKEIKVQYNDWMLVACYSEGHN